MEQPKTAMNLSDLLTPIFDDFELTEEERSEIQAGLRKLFVRNVASLAKAHPEDLTAHGLPIVVVREMCNRAKDALGTSSPTAESTPRAGGSTPPAQSIASSSQPSEAVPSFMSQHGADDKELGRGGGGKGRAGWPDHEDYGLEELAEATAARVLDTGECSNKAAHHLSTSTNHSTTVPPSPHQVSMSHRTATIMRPRVSLPMTTPGGGGDVSPLRRQSFHSPSSNIELGSNLLEADRGAPTAPLSAPVLSEPSTTHSTSYLQPPSPPGTSNTAVTTTSSSFPLMHGGEASSSSDGMVGTPAVEPEHDTNSMVSQSYGAFRGGGLGLGGGLGVVGKPHGTLSSSSTSTGGGLSWGAVPPPSGADEDHTLARLRNMMAWSSSSVTNEGGQQQDTTATATATPTTNPPASTMFSPTVGPGTATCCTDPHSHGQMQSLTLPAVSDTTGGDQPNYPRPGSAFKSWDDLSLFQSQGTGASAAMAQPQEQGGNGGNGEGGEGGSLSALAGLLGNLDRDQLARLHELKNQLSQQPHQQQPDTTTRSNAGSESEEQRGGPASTGPPPPPPPQQQQQQQQTGEGGQTQSMTAANLIGALATLAKTNPNLQSLLTGLQTQQAAGPPAPPAETSQTIQQGGVSLTITRSNDQQQQQQQQAQQPQPSGVSALQQQGSSSSLNASAPSYAPQPLPSAYAGGLVPQPQQAMQQQQPNDDKVIITSPDEVRWHPPLAWVHPVIRWLRRHNLCSWVQPLAPSGRPLGQNFLLQVIRAVEHPTYSRGFQVVARRLPGKQKQTLLVYTTLSREALEVICNALQEEISDAAKAGLIPEGWGKAGQNEPPPGLEDLPGTSHGGQGHGSWWVDSLYNVLERRLSVCRVNNNGEAQPTASHYAPQGPQPMPRQPVPSPPTNYAHMHQQQQQQQPPPYQAAQPAPPPGPYPNPYAANAMHPTTMTSQNGNVSINLDLVAALGGLSNITGAGVGSYLSPGMASRAAAAMARKDQDNNPEIPLCQRYQRGVCRSKVCKYRHRCGSCSGAHPQKNCPRNPAPLSAQAGYPSPSMQSSGTQPDTPSEGSSPTNSASHIPSIQGMMGQSPMAPLLASHPLPPPMAGGLPQAHQQQYLQGLVESVGLPPPPQPFQQQPQHQHPQAYQQLQLQQQQQQQPPAYQSQQQQQPQPQPYQPPAQPYPTLQGQQPPPFGL
ncbi:unnamed protein product [Vitrella brassicaformis CCMP3155]|uniref:C3H1-type domain-containing protein n=3 Tax=Vitrella brassicaformis TaxID=1169539 RepID=A0A0G4FJX4_VITBC|nr:unnamed protein product [Vitrella brassicaformis CCMP3155]|eukprot:CEM13695.1 unnamed protein product [Vitrella brassicaformis CCMP3155]